MTRQERRQERRARQRRRRIAVAGAGFVVAVTVSVLVAPAMAEGRHRCEGVVSIILLGENCESRSDHSGPRYIDTSDDRREAESVAPNRDGTAGHELVASRAAAPPPPRHRTPRQRNAPLAPSPTEGNR
jgi:hypothetical protein